MILEALRKDFVKQIQSRVVDVTRLEIALPGEVGLVIRRRGVDGAAFQILLFGLLTVLGFLFYVLRILTIRILVIILNNLHPRRLNIGPILHWRLRHILCQLFLEV